MKTKTMSRILALLLSVVMAVGIMPMTAFAAISVPAVSATVTAPVAGAHPDFIAISGDDEKYTVEVSRWRDNSTMKWLKVTDTFEAGKDYLVSVCFTPKDGYSLDKTTETINGQTAYYDGSNDSTGAYWFKTTFSIPGPLTFENSVDYDIPAGFAGIKGLSNKVFTASGGTAPYTFSIDTPVPGLSIDSENRLIYSRPDTATAATTATIKVTDSATTPATQTVTVNIGETKVAVVVSTLSATVTAPVAGSHPDLSPFSGDDEKYTVEIISWCDKSTLNWLSATDTFEAGKEYRLNVKFTPKDGYTLLGSPSVTIDGQSVNYGGSNSSTGSKTYYTDFVIPGPLTFEDNVDYDISAGIVGIKGFSNKVLRASGGTAPYAFSIDTPVPGLSIDSENRLIYSRPDTATAATTATIKCTDSLGATKTIIIDVGAVALNVNFADTADYDIPAGYEGTTYTSSTPLTAINGIAPYTFSINTPVPGLSIDSENRLVFTRPAVCAATTATIKCTDSLGATKTITIDVGAVSETPAPIGPSTPSQPTTPTQPTTPVQQPTTQQPTTPVQQPTTPAVTSPTPAVTQPATTVKKPKATSIKKLSKAKKSFKVTYKKISGVTGYQVKYSTSKKYTKKTTKTVTIKGSKKTSKTIKKLKAKKKYYVKVRTYKKVKINGKTKTVYSSWSKTKTVTTK